MAFDPTILVATAVAAVLGIGALWDLMLSARLAVPTWCSFLRMWNTESNDLLAMIMAAATGYLFQVHYETGGRWLLFLAWAFLGLWLHLFGLWFLHKAHIEAEK